MQVTDSDKAIRALGFYIPLSNRCPRGGWPHFTEPESFSALSNLKISKAKDAGDGNASCKKWDKNPGTVTSSPM